LQISIQIYEGYIRVDLKVRTKNEDIKLLETKSGIFFLKGLKKKLWK